MAFINFGMANTLAQAKASANKNKLFFPTDSKKIAIDGKEYGGIDGVDIESKNSMYGVVGNGNNITDGVAAIKGIKGNTIAWNQLLKENKLVDMGLPSGTLWASCNIDITQEDGFAASPFQYDCSFFSWGNIDGHNPISESAFDYNWGGINQQEPWYEGQVYGDTQGNTLINNIPVGDNYDAARVNLGSLFRMPTTDNYNELLNNIIYINADGTEVDTTKTDKRVTVNGIVGLYIQSKINGARLFFAASGYGNDTSRSSRSASGLYWNSTWSSASYSRSLYFSRNGVNSNSNNNRYVGSSVRAVVSKSDLIQNGKDGRKFALSANNKNITDVTLIYGSNNEPTSVEQFEADYQRWFGKPLTYEPYDVGSLRNVKMSAIKTTGFNQWDEEWEIGGLDNNTGATTNQKDRIRSKNFFPCFPNTNYFIRFTNDNTKKTIYVYFYDSSKNYISYLHAKGNEVIVSPNNACYMKFRTYNDYGTTYNHDICINISDSSKNGTYEPYRENIASLPITTLTGKLNGQGESVTIFPD